MYFFWSIIILVELIYFCYFCLFVILLVFIYDAMHDLLRVVGALIAASFFSFHNIQTFLKFSWGGVHWGFFFVSVFIVFFLRNLCFFKVRFFFAEFWWYLRQRRKHALAWVLRTTVTLLCTYVLTCSYTFMHLGYGIYL